MLGAAARLGWSRLPRRWLCTYGIACDLFEAVGHPTGRTKPTVADPETPVDVLSYRSHGRNGARHPRHRPRQVLRTGREVDADVAGAGRAVVEAAAERDAPLRQEVRRRFVAQPEPGAVEPREIGRLRRSPGDLGEAVREVVTQLVAIGGGLLDHRAELRVSVFERSLRGDHAEQPRVLVQRRHPP